MLCSNPIQWIKWALTNITWKTKMAHICTLSLFAMSVSAVIFMIAFLFILCLSTCPNLRKRFLFWKFNDFEKPLKMNKRLRDLLRICLVRLVCCSNVWLCECVFLIFIPILHSSTVGIHSKTYLNRLFVFPILRFCVARMHGDLWWNRMRQTIQ